MVAWVEKRKNINVYALSLGELGSVLSLAKLNFTLKFFCLAKFKTYFENCFLSLKFIPLGILSNIFISGSFPIFYERFLITTGPSSLNVDILFANIQLYSSLDSLSSA